MILAPFSSCCCYEFWLPFPPAAAEAPLLLLLVPGWENTMEKITYEFWPGPLMQEKHHASEGRRSPKIAPRKCLT